MVQHTYVSLPSNQTGNKHFCLQFVGFSINVAHLFVFAGTNWENPVQKSGNQNFNGVDWVLYFDFLDDFWL